MAERRMFSKNVIDTDLFLDLPLSAQALYFHLGLHADDEGFVGNPKKIQKMLGASDDDFKLLIVKQLIICFDSGVIAICDWKIHNYIPKDRFKKTTFLTEKKSLYTACIQTVYKSDTQVRVGKDRIDKDISTTTTTADTEAKKERTTAPTYTEIAMYMKNELCIDNASKEAEKFQAYNELLNWSCLPNWKAAAHLWCSRIGEKK